MRNAECGIDRSCVGAWLRGTMRALILRTPHSALFPAPSLRFRDDQPRRPFEPQPLRVQHQVVDGGVLTVAAVVMTSSGDATARVRARRSSSPGARSSRWATSSVGRPARRATSSTNWLSIRCHPSVPATSCAMSEPPEPYWRVIVMTGGAIRGGGGGGWGGWGAYRPG